MAAAPRAIALLALLALLALAAGCPGNGGRKQPYATPEASAFVAHLRAAGEAARSYFGESTMDYWVGGERIKATVYVMGERGAKVRFNAINPATNDTAADLACDGSTFQFIDYPKNCQLTGVCDRTAIAQLLRVRLEPDDFLLLAVGTAPLIPDPTGTARWDGKRGAWIVELVSPDRAWRQELVLDGDDKDGKWEVLAATVWDAQGQIDWKLENRDFRTVQGADGRSFRVAARTKFEQPAQKADLVAVWENRQINLELDDSKFVMQIPPGLKVCGRQGGATGAPATGQPAPEQPAAEQPGGATDGAAEQGSTP